MANKVDIKVVLLGSAMSGKTSLVERYLYERFTGANQSTVGAAFGAKTVQVGRRTVTMGIWDTAGSERFEAMSKIYYRDAKAAVVCFDVTERKSWDRVPFWVKELKEHEPNCALYVCGTKEDLLESHERGLDELVVQRFCVDNNAQYFETSSRTGSNVDALFRAIAEHYTRDTPGHGSTDSPWASSSEAVQASGEVALGKGRPKMNCCS